MKDKSIKAFAIRNPIRGGTWTLFTAGWKCAATAGYRIAQP